MPPATDNLRIACMKAISLTGLVLAILSTDLLADNTLTVTSHDHKTGLLELFTSEGCNSCPPAERWLGTLAANGYHDHQLIPIAFHVDYWDYLGWRDIYANPEYSKRHQKHVVQNRLSTAYTPQLILDGKNLRPSRLLGSRLNEINKKKVDTHITLTAKILTEAAIQLEATVTDDAGTTAKNPELFIALVTEKIISPVAAGENAGHTLTHHHVARKLLGPFTVNNNDKTSISKQINLPAGNTIEGTSIVAFLQTKQQEILQAVRLPLK